jgi:hypothetical protein
MLMMSSRVSLSTVLFISEIIGCDLRAPAEREDLAEEQNWAEGNRQLSSSRRSPFDHEPL